MKRKAHRGESRELRNLRKLAHERAAQIGAAARPRIDLEEILGVPVGPVDTGPLTSATSGPVGPDAPTATASSDRASGERPSTGPLAGPTRRRELSTLAGAGLGCNLRLLTELQLSTGAILAAPVMRWNQVQYEAANCYLKAVRNAIEGLQKVCRATIAPGGSS